MQGLWDAMYITQFSKYEKIKDVQMMERIVLWRRLAHLIKQRKNG